jgi:serine/threonine protein kinase
MVLGRVVLTDHAVQVKTLATIRHRHIVKLLCCCTKRDSNLLVYEYMPNGSLGDLLHSTKAATLTWEIRYKIAMGAAMVRSCTKISHRVDAFHFGST